MRALEIARMFDAAVMPGRSPCVACGTPSFLAYVTVVRCPPATSQVTYPMCPSCVPLGGLLLTEAGYVLANLVPPC